MKNYRPLIWTIFLVFRATSSFAVDEGDFQPLITSESAGDLTDDIDPRIIDLGSEDGIEKLNKYGLGGTVFFSAPVIRAPDNYAGIVIQWNYNRYDAAQSPDDWDYLGFSLLDRFHPEQNSVLREGYVYMHALLTNTNSFPVLLDTTSPKIDVAFVAQRFGWNKGFFAPMPDSYCDLELLGESMKNKIVDPVKQAETVSRFFQFSLADNKIDAEIFRQEGTIRLEPGQSVLGKWYAKEKETPEYVRLLPKGVLPKGIKCPLGDMVPEFYEHCGNGKLNYNFLDFCTETRNANGKLLFNFHAPSRLMIFLNQDIMISVQEIGQKSFIKKIFIRGMKTREFETNKQ